MISKIIAASVQNKFVILMCFLLLVLAAGWATLHSPVDAVPDLSDTEVIIVTNYPGQAPDVVQAQVTYPLETSLMGIPDAKVVRGTSMYETSFVYVIFKGGTNLYWARSRVLEYLNYAKTLLPPGVNPQLGPDATGVGWVYQYALFPGWYCKNHPQGIWHDAKMRKWYAHQAQAPEKRRNELTFVRAFDRPGKSPLSGHPLVASNENLATLRTLQDWHLRYELESVPGVAEVATLGGFVKEYQIILEPSRLRAYNLSIGHIMRAVQASNNDVGGSTVDMSEMQYLVRSQGYLRGLKDFRTIPVGVGPNGTPILLSDVAHLQIAGKQRQGICEWDGRGEVVGGIVEARWGANARKVISRVKKKLTAIQNSLPPGVLIKTGYDRANLIDRSIATLRDTLIEEMIVVAAVCIVFLLHGRSALVAIFVIPSSMLVSMLIMYYLKINANIMSLGGIAIAIGVVVDSAIIMVENAHNHLSAEENHVAAGGKPRPFNDIILESAMEVGPSLFFSLLIITVSFLPIFVLHGESGRMFRPLAYTKTFAIGAACILSITVIPILMSFFITPRLLPRQWPAAGRAAVIALIFLPALFFAFPPVDRGLLLPCHWWLCLGWIIVAALLVLPQRIIHEEHNPVSRVLQWLYNPAFKLAMDMKYLLLGLAVLALATTIWPLSRLGTQFSPPLNEGVLLYMPTTYPGIGITEAKVILQQTDRMIKSYPLVRSVWGQIGRANTATDSAPMDMVDTVVRLKPVADWPKYTVARFYDGWPHWLSWPFRRTFWPDKERIDKHELINGWKDAAGVTHPGLNARVQFPGLSNYWTMPIKNRTDMLNTGTKTLIGARVMGPSLTELSRLSSQVASALQRLPETRSAVSDRPLGGYYLDITPNRAAAARYGITVGAIQNVIQTALGGMTISTMVKGVERFPIDLRYASGLRGRPSAIRRVLVKAPTGAQIPLGELATIRIDRGPPMINSQDTLPVSYISINSKDPNISGYVAAAKRAIRHVNIPTGYSVSWVGEYQHIRNADARLLLAGPAVVLIIFVLLFVATRSVGRVLLIMLSAPFSCIGAFWLLWLLHYELSTAVWVGMIALAGLSTETAVVMLLYLDTSFKAFEKAGRMRTERDLYDAVHDGAVKRIRPKTMTVAAAFVGLTPLLWAHGAGADVMRRLAAPLIGGLFSSFIMELLLFPVIYFIAKRIVLRDVFRKNQPPPPRPVVVVEDKDTVVVGAAS